MFCGQIAKPELVQPLAAERQNDGLCHGGKRALPCLCGLDRIAGAEHQQVWDRPQRGQMFDRLVGRPVFAKADGIMRHHIDNALAHQRRQADRRAAVIGKDKKGAAIGNRPAMQRDAVHRRRHAMFAHPVMNIGAGRLLSRL